MARKVVGRAGRRWRVSRRWVPRLGTETLWGRFHRRTRQAMRRAGGIAEHADIGCFEVFGEGVVAGILIIVAVLLAIFVVYPVLVALLDIAILVLLALLAAVARVVLRRPWIVEATADDGASLRWRIIGWRASAEQVDEVARQLEAGVIPPNADTAV